MDLADKFMRSKPCDRPSMNEYRQREKKLRKMNQGHQEHDSNGLFWTLVLRFLKPTLKAAVFALQLFVDSVVWKKVVYIDRLLQLFKYVPREQFTIPDIVFQHDLEVNGGKGVIVDPRTKYVYQRP